MADRTTHEIETPVEKHKVVLLDWITGGEKRKMSSLKGTDVENAIEMLKLVVRSVDDFTGGIMSPMDEMHGKDFDFVLSQVTDVIENSSFKKKSETN